MNYTARINALCKQLDVERVTVQNVDYSYSGRRYDTGRRVIGCAPLTNELAYTVALHELGHAAHRHNGKSAEERLYGYCSPATLKREGEAWLWALQRHTPSPLVAVKCLWYLDTYRERLQAGRAKPVEFERAWLALEQLVKGQKPAPAPRAPRPHSPIPGQLAFDFVCPDPLYDRQEALGEARELDGVPEPWDDEYWAFVPGEEEE